MMPEATTTCSRCVMDTTDPEIVFDSRGICSHCHHYDSLERMYSKYYGRTYEERERKLAKFIGKIKEEGQGKKYDCTIGLSGGVDSSYVAYLVHQSGLRPLAVHLDNGWDSDTAKGNIKRIVERLNIDMYDEILAWDEFRDLQVAFLKSSTPDCEIPTDHAIDEIMHQSARKNSITFNVNGYNYKTETHLPGMWSQGHGDWIYIHGIHERFGKIPLKSFPHFSAVTHLRRRYSKSYHTLFGVPRQLNILNYLDYRKNDAIRVMEKELGYEFCGGKHNESVYTRFYQGYILPTKFGYDKRKSHYSSLICSGQMTKEEAIQELEKPPYPVKEQLEDRKCVLMKLGMDDDEFERIMALPKKSYWDYPHSSLFDRDPLKYLRFIVEVLKSPLI